jgi:hypothetical protein
MSKSIDDYYAMRRNELYCERVERIATAVLAGLHAVPMNDLVSPETLAGVAVDAAESLLAEIRKRGESDA